MIAGPRNPPRLPNELMSPTEAARAEPTEMDVGSVQNPGIQAKTEAPVRQSQAKLMVPDWPGNMLSAKKTAAQDIGA